MKPWHLGLLLVMNAFWAASYSAYKILGPALGTGGIVTLRFGLAAVCLLPLWPWLPGKAPRGWDLVKTCGMGVVLFAFGHRLQVYGNNLGTAGNSAILMSVEPIVTSIGAAVFLREQIGPRRVAGCALCSVGVVLTSGVGRSDFRWIGLTASLIFISSFICESAYSIVGKPVIARAGVLKMLALSLLSGTLVNLALDGPATLASASVLSGEGWLLIGFLGVVCTAVGYGVWFVIIRDSPISVAVLTIFTQSVFGVVIAAIWLDEKLQWGQVLGSGCILLGLLLGFSRQLKRTAGGPQQQPV